MRKVLTPAEPNVAWDESRDQLFNSNLNASVAVSVYGAEDWPEIASVWSELEGISPYGSFYLSADWAAAWMEVFGKLLRPQILVFEQNSAKIGICLLTSSVEQRGPFGIRRIYLNTGGERIAERTMMEFNNILCCPGKEDAVARALWRYLRSRDWDEFAIQGILPGPILTALEANALPKLPASVRIHSTYYVDLDQLRQSGLCYLDSLSSNTRSQIRRSLRYYSGRGEIKVEIAPDVQTAEKYFAEMCRMHQSTWLARGVEGAFGPGRRLEFHNRLIGKTYEKGTTHLLRVAADEETIGILYNFVQGGKIYFFQSGFNYARDRRLHPGLVTHCSAIQRYMEMGFNEYDFLAGDARYKASLAKHSKPLAWVVFARPGIKRASIELLRVIKRRLKDLW